MYNLIVWDGCAIDQSINQCSRFETIGVAQKKVSAV